MRLLPHGTVLEPRIPHKSHLRHGRHSKTQSTYASLKTHMKDILGSFREKDSAHIIDGRFPKSVSRYDTHHPLLELSTSFSNDPNSHTNSSYPPVESAKQRFRASNSLARKVGRQIGGLRSEPVRYPAARSEPLQGNISHGQQHGVEIESPRIFDNGKLNPFSTSRDTRLLETMYSGTESLPCDPQVSWHPRRVDSPTREERNHSDIAPDISFFHTSSQSGSESIRQFPHGRMMSKIKRNTLNWLRDAFSRDEHERAFFESRRSMPIEGFSQQYSTSMFIDGRRVARDCRN
jgi:hypothetical protein